ncbi:MAG: sigma-70 family RNA polymerase sigma factor, partial [Myxococcales bacterium]|nr:sigma-70 family RNA polymerase sigma factor [Myxococcales bacterium]
AAQRVGDSGESSLLQRLRAGEEDAYHELLRVHGGRLLVVARRLMRSEEDARDCVQDAFLSAFRSIDRFEAKAQLGTWLYRILVNACLMRLRARKRTPEELVDPQTPEFDQYGFRNGPSEMSPLSVEDLLEREEVRETLRKAIDGLPDNYRIVLILRDIEELDTAETAEKLGMTPGAVKVRLHRARLALSEQIGSLFR